MDQNNSGETLPPRPPPPQDPQSGSPPDSQLAPPTQPLPPLKSNKSFTGRIRELMYPLSLAATSFAVSFAVGVMAANVAAAGLASQLMARAEAVISYG